MEETFMERLVVHAFVDGVRDSEIKQALILARPSKFEDALTRALEFDAAKQTARSHVQVRLLNQDQDDFEVVIREMAKKIIGEKKQIQCWTFGQLGHIQRRCKQNKEMTFSKNYKHCHRAEDKNVALIRRTTVVNDRWHSADLQKDQEDDLELKAIIRWKRAERKPIWQDITRESPTVKSYWAQWNSLVMEDGLLKRVFESQDSREKRTQILIPKKRVPEVIQEVHGGTTGGRFGLTRTLIKLGERFYWAGCKEDVKEWCKKCTTCAASNGPQVRKRAPMRQYNVGSPFERIAIDIAGPFPETESGNKYIVVK